MIKQERIQANKYRSISIRAEQYLYVLPIISSPISCIALWYGSWYSPGPVSIDIKLKHRDYSIVQGLVFKLYHV